MPYHSAELRWFFSGQPVPKLLSWFKNGPLPLNEEVRTDHYLLGTGKELNAKLREGKIELKQLQWTLPINLIHDNLGAQMEGWTKWSFDLSGEESYQVLSRAQPRSWLAVDKNRLMRQFSVSNGRVIELDSESEAKAGCNLEVTTVEASNQSWYTIGFEAFGEPVQLRDMLRRIAIYVTERDFPIQLKAADALSYAAWIEKYFVQ